MEVNVKAIEKLLLGKNRTARLETRQLMTNPNLHLTPSATLAEKREQTLKSLQYLVDNNLVNKAFPKEYGGEENFTDHVASFEELAVAEPSLQVKSGVQFGLFAGAIQHLGTKQHHDKWLRDAISLKLVGCYAMTESGHGSDVFALQTTAVYNPATEKFTINTPSRSAWKDYIGNAGKHATHAVVFAQLETLNEQHGVHAFLVPIRNNKGVFLPGIVGEDNGTKGGLLGVDNGRLSFNHVEVPRFNLLNKYGNVEKDGTYTSPIKNPKRRFFTMLGTLVQGRVSLNGAAVVANKMALQIAVTYAHKRTQFENATGAETNLINYQTHQYRLLPLLANTYASVFAHNALIEQFAATFKELTTSPTGEVDSMQDLETEAAIMKALTTWQANHTLQQAREACGGNGYLSENRLVNLRADFDVYATFEGDNTVLCQLVGKRILTEYGASFKGLTKTQQLNKVLKERIEQLETKINSRSNLLHKNTINLDLVEKMLKAKISKTTKKLVAVLRDANTVGNSEAVFNNHQQEVVEMAKTYGQLKQFKLFKEEVVNFSKNHTHEASIVELLVQQFAVNLVREHSEWFTSENMLTSRGLKNLLQFEKETLKLIATHSQTLVNAFGYDNSHLRATILN